MYTRIYYQTLLKRLSEPRRFMQILTGPRQVGKTTLAQQTLKDLPCATHFASADEPTLKDNSWVSQQWNHARLKLSHQSSDVVLVLDEIQKIQGWSETIKRLWDEDSFEQRSLKVVLLGSSALLIHEGLTESLAGRFERIHIPHWSFEEMQAAFGFDLDTYFFFGGYPGSASLIGEINRWRQYLLDALIETTIARDVLLLKRVDKPALLRRLFQLGCTYSGQILSYQKMLGHLQDAGNTTTLSHYLELLQKAGMIQGLQKYAKGRHRASSPKLQVHNTALMTALSSLSLAEAKADGNYWGRLVESSIGAHLVNSSLGNSIEIFYWREGNNEVDFVVQNGEKLVAIEVKSGRSKASFSGINKLEKIYPVYRKILVGASGIPLSEFLKISIQRLFE